ncbi:hypothetical protein AB205_0181290 [Aquarana catesbeiana]|uniref:BESS domain-containing protein n=1 Tax=Aquarana catesbeiana TaxID=8400 RepID=A0A2G9QEC7_AQUCT|nr:hypothetical protein AB205_0181290 [Aquarana catesbeiana]
MRDAYRKNIRHLKEARSDSGAAPRVPYMFAKDLDFLQPIVEMRETEASWEEQDVMDVQLEAQPEAQDQICVEEGPEDLSQIQTSSNLWETNTDEQSAVAEAIPGPSSAPANIVLPAKVPRRRPPLSQPDIGEHLLEMLKNMSEKVDAFLCPDTILALSFVPLIKKVKPERYFEMRRIIEQVLHSFSEPREEASFQVPYVPPPRPPLNYPRYVHYPEQHHQPYPYNPPSYPSSFEKATSRYEVTHSNIPYSIPSPIPSIRPPLLNSWYVCDKSTWRG